MTMDDQIRCQMD